MDLVAWAHQAEAAAGIARTLAPTSFVPDAIKVWEHPEHSRDPAKRGALDMDSTVAQVTAVLLAGQELGLKPMASLRSFTIIRGTVAMHAIAARALLLKNGHEIEIRETTSQRAIVDGRRAGAEKWQRSTWNLERAKTARLFPGPENGPWKTQTQSMLVARATAESSRWVAADALLGIPVMVEELEGEPGSNGMLPPGSAAIETATDDAPAAVEPKRARRKPPSTARAALPSGPPAEVPPEPDPPQQTLAQNAKKRTAMFAALRAIGVTDPVEARGMIAAWVGHPVESSNHLTETEANVVIERADAIKSIAATDQADDEEGAPPDAEPDAG
jgi:hypothetical protein